MIILNFSHPFSSGQLTTLKTTLKNSLVPQEHNIASLEQELDIAIGLVRNIPVQINHGAEDNIYSQVEKLSQELNLTPEQWQNELILVNLPGYAPAAACVLTEIHGRSGHFPSIIVLKPVERGPFTEYVVSEVLNLQTLRNERARLNRKEIVSVENQPPVLSKPKRFVMLTLVSDKTLPNIIPVFQEHAPEFSAIYFLNTGQFRERYDQTIKILNGSGRYPGLKLEWYSPQIDNADPEITRKVASGLIKELNEKALQEGFVAEIVCNWTLGTKAMAVGLVDAARENRSAVIYVDTEKSRLMDRGKFYPGELEQKPIQVRLSIREYLQAYGMYPLGRGKPAYPEDNYAAAADIIVKALCGNRDQVEKSHWLYNGSASKQNSATQELELGFFPAVHKVALTLSDALKGAGFKNSDGQNLSLSELDLAGNEIAAERFQKYLDLDVRFYGRENAILAEKLQDRGLVKDVERYPKGEGHIGVKFRLASFTALHFLDGAWLEYFVYWRLKKLYDPAGGGVDGLVAQGVEFRWNTTGESVISNELDVLLLSNIKLSIISCKSGSHLRKESPEINTPLYHLETIAQKAGLFLQKYLVIAQPRVKLSEIFKDRAEEVLGIPLITLDDLPDIEKYI